VSNAALFVVDHPAHNNSKLFLSVLETKIRLFFSDAFLDHVEGLAFLERQMRDRSVKFSDLQEK